MLFSPKTGIKLMTEVHPALAARGVFMRGAENCSLSLTDLDKLCRFVVLFADEGSKYYREKDYTVRVRICLQDLKLPAQSAVGKEILQKGDTFLEMLTEYFKIANNVRFEAWLSLKMEFHSLTSMMRSEVTMTDVAVGNRLKLADQIHKISVQVAEMDHRLFPDANTARLVSETVSRPNYAEKYAL